jgi:4-hydroxy-tetrahydrodipicolinate synthase
MDSKYSGVWPTMVTAFTEEGTLDIEGNKAITEYLIGKGSNGLFAVCQSSEMFMLSLEEKVALATCVVEAAGGRVPVIASGHTSDALEDQIEELRAISQTGVDAVVIVSNRLAKQEEGSDVLIGNLKAIMDAIPEVKFGVYECPYPYRRLLTDEELKWCAETGRVVFLKDVSCDAATERRRTEVVKGTGLNLFNANTETLLESLRAGYNGYNGVMGNFHIDLYQWLYTHYKEAPEAADALQSDLTKYSDIENHGYPINAKYHMRGDGVDMSLYSRRLSAEKFGKAEIELVEALISWEEETRKKLGL